MAVVWPVFVGRRSRDGIPGGVFWRLSSPFLRRHLIVWGIARRLSARREMAVSHFASGSKLSFGPLDELLATCMPVRGCSSGTEQPVAVKFFVRVEVSTPVI
jgi:hypothetical protein